MSTAKPYYKTKQAVDATLQLFFTNPDTDSVSVHEIFRRAGRDARKETRNRAWLSNKLTTLRDENGDYIKVDYSTTGRRKVARVSLTAKGREALGRPEKATLEPLTHTVNASMSAFTDASQLYSVTPETVLRDVKILKEQLPNFNIVFKIEPKEEVEQR